MKDAFIAISGLILQAGVGFSAIFLFKMAIVSKSALGRFAGKLDASTRGITNRAKDFGENRGFYQRRQMARDSRKQEQRRENVSNYAEAITGNSFRSKMLRRRAAGGLTGQLAGTVSGGRIDVNAAGQERQRLTGVSQLEKLEHEEMQQAAMLIEASKVTSPKQLQAIAAGTAGTGVTGAVVNGAGNHALQRAAVQKLIDAQDAEQLENLMMNRTNVERDADGNIRSSTQGNVDLGGLVAQLESSKNYSTSKGAGAHLVGMHGKKDPTTGQFVPYTQDEVQKAAAVNMSKLAVDKLAQQDGPAWDSALQGFKNDVGNPDTLLARQELWRRVEAISNDKRSQALLKGASKKAYAEILGKGLPTT